MMHTTHAVLALALLLAASNPGAAQSNTPARTTASVPTDSARAASFARADLGRIRGSADAAIWLIVISDFECSFCKRWHEETKPEIERNYVRTGKVRLAYLNFPVSTHRNAQPAHELAMCAAEQEQFWPVADAIFATQSAWKRRSDAVAFFDSLAGSLNLDHARLRACVASGEFRSLIRTDYERAARIGVGSTPSFLVGGRPMIGAQPYAAFARAIEEALAAPRTTP